MNFLLININIAANRNLILPSGGYGTIIAERERERRAGVNIF
jgi:hypothetical protein